MVSRYSSLFCSKHHPIDGTLSSSQPLLSISNTGHAQDRPNLRHSPGHKVHQPQARKRNTETSELLKPSMKVGGRHEQHPPHQPGNSKRELNASRCRITALGLHGLLLDRYTCCLPVVERDQASVSQSLHACESRQELEPEQGRAEDKQENVAANVVSALPRATHSLARRRRNELACIAHIVPRVRVAQALALAAGEAEHGVDERGPEEPLRDEDPVRRDRAVPDDSIDPALGDARAKARVEHDEDAERQRRPEPANLDKVHVEHVLLLRKIARCELGRVRLRDRGVRGAARGGRQCAEDAAEEQRERVDGEELGLEARGEEGGAPRRGERRADGAAGHAAGEGDGAVDGGLGSAAC
jgi:hypothetical protein